MARDESGNFGKLHAHRSQHGDRLSHDRRLGVFGEAQLVVRSVTHQTEKALPERLVDFVEYVSRGPAGAREGSAHAYRLTALSRKDESAHRPLRK